MYMKRFAYDQFFQPYQVHSFLNSFFSDANVLAQLKVISGSDTWCSLGSVTKDSIKWQELKSTVLSLNFFDKLQQNGIIRSNGSIAKCLDEYYSPPSDEYEPGDFIISDLLRKTILDPCFDSYELFDDEERNEFIFHIFKRLVLGGTICQFEDEWTEYLETTKLIYKDLVRVQKERITSNLMIASHVYQIKNLESSVAPLFPMEHTQNFMYVSIDPVRRNVSVWYHASPSYYQ
ncbi:hypothetical protein BKA69DRAFT_427363 [Paraphysoderma sedebokerense]|nr:hypothetical protein BKA69DRAFT_427363 [Paraphysoderma sedebokerense]